MASYISTDPFAGFESFAPQQTPKPRYLSIDPFDGDDDEPVQTPKPKPASAYLSVDPFDGESAFDGAMPGEPPLIVRTQPQTPPMSLDPAQSMSPVPATMSPLPLTPGVTPATEKPPTSRASDMAYDAARGIVKGTAIGLPESAIGLASIVSGGRAGQLADALGFAPDKLREKFDKVYPASERLQKASEMFQREPSIVKKAIAALTSPELIASTLFESAPSMIAGGLAGRALSTITRMSPLIGSAIGEGGIGAGQSAEAMRQSTPERDLSMWQSALAASSGALTTAISRVGGKIAAKLGVDDVDALLAGAVANPAARRNLVKQFTYGLIQEGLFEEGLQSPQEQAAQNIGTGKPWNKDLAESWILGTIAGSLMGGGGNLASATASNLQARQTPAQYLSTDPLAGTTPTSEAAPEAPKFASTQLNLPPEVADRVRAFSTELIPDSVLAEDGRETTPHITARFGLKADEDVNRVREILADIGPIPVTLGKTSIFQASESGGADVVKIDVDSPALRKLRTVLEDELDAPGETHTDYKPHSTLGYVRAGEGAQFAGRDDLAGTEMVLDRLTFSRPDGTTIDIPLTGGTEAASDRPWRVNPRGNLDVSFPSAPSPETAQTLREAGWALNQPDKTWYAPDTAENRALAENLYRAETAPPVQRVVPPAGPQIEAIPVAKAAEVEPGGYYRVPVEELSLAPERFQYKSNTNKEGVTPDDRIAGPWNEDYAGQILAWKDPDTGQLFVVNGHHRVDAAKRLGANEMTVRVLPEMSVAAARVRGALANIADDKGTAIDAAKVLRHMPADQVREAGVDLTKKRAKDGTALAQLSDPMFERVVSGEISQPVGIAIGEGALTPEAQMSVAKLLETQAKKGRELSPGVVRALIQQAKDAPEVAKSSDQMDIFGQILGEEQTQNLAIEVAALQDWASSTLGNLKRTFRFVSKANRAALLTNAGNQLNQAGNESSAEQAAVVKATFDQLATKAGPINRALKDAAQRVYNGDNIHAVRTDLLNAITAAVSQELGRPMDRPAGVVAVDPGRVGGGAPGSAAVPAGSRPAGGIVGQPTQSAPVVSDQTVPPQSHAAAALPAELAGAKPRFNIGTTAYEPQFASDLDRAAFIISQKTPSKRDADYLAFVRAQTGLSETKARAYGARVRAELKGILRGKKPGRVPVPFIGPASSPTKLRQEGLTPAPRLAIDLGNGMVREVASFEEAGRLADQMRDRLEEEGRGGMSDFPRVIIRDLNTNQPIAHVSYNGRIWRGTDFGATNKEEIPRTDDRGYGKAPAITVEAQREKIQALKDRDAPEPVIAHAENKLAEMEAAPVDETGGDEHPAITFTKKALANIQARGDENYATNIQDFLQKLENRSGPVGGDASYTIPTLGGSRGVWFNLKTGKPSGIVEFVRNIDADQGSGRYYAARLVRKIGDDAYRDSRFDDPRDHLKDGTVSLAFPADWNYIGLPAVEDTISTGEVQPRLPEAGAVRDLEITPEQLARVPSGSYTLANLKAAMRLSDEQAAALDAYVQAIGLDTGKIRFEFGAKAGRGLAQDEDYRGQHTSPDRESGAPASDLTGAGSIYPDDVYGPNDVQYYGTGERQMDARTFGILRSLRGRPNAFVTIYRAVPYKASAAEQIEDLEGQKRHILRRGKLPAGVKTALTPNDYYNKIHADIQALREAPAVESEERIGINPGDWVTVNRQYAKDHGEGALNGAYRIVSKRVRAGDIFTNGDSIHEWGYDPPRTKTQGEQADPNILRQVAPRILYHNDKTGKDDPLFDKPGVKGEVEFLQDGTAVVRGFEMADFSTAVHEILGHVARRQLVDLGVPAELRAGVTDDDIRAVSKWAGATEAKGTFTWDVAAEEKFARGMERVLYEGDHAYGRQVPRFLPPAVHRAFRKVRDWLKAIYVNLASSPINIEISPEARKVFDRLLTRTERVQMAQAHTAPIQPVQTGMGPQAERPPPARPAGGTKPKQQGFGFKADEQARLFQRGNQKSELFGTAPPEGAEPPAQQGPQTEELFETPRPTTEPAKQGSLNIPPAGNPPTATPPNGPGWKARVDSLLTAFKENVVNDWQRVKDLEREPGLRKSGKLTPYERRKLMPGRLGQQVEAVEDRVQAMDRDLVETAKRIGIPEQDLQADVYGYLIARHAPERNAAIGERAAGMSDQEAAARMQDIGAKPYTTEVQRLADELQAFHDETLDLLHADGRAEAVVDRDLYTKLRETYPHHMPLQRVFENEDVGAQMMGERGLNVRSTGLKRATGSERAIRDLAENIYTARLDAIKRVEKNIVDNETFRLAKDYITSFPGQTLFEIVEPKAIGTDWQGKILREQMTDPHILAFRHQGKPAYVKVNDDRLAMALRGVNREELPGWLRAIGGVTRFLSGMYTRYAPEFPLPNKIRDLQEVMVVLAADGRLKSRGVKQLLGKDPASVAAIMDYVRGNETDAATLYRQFLADGSTTGGMALSTRNEVAKSLESIRKLNRQPARQALKRVVDTVDGVNRLFEDSTRFTVYRIGLENGLSREKAAVLAKTASIDFNEFGRLGPTINSLYMFANASIQGNANMFRAMRDPKVASAVIASIGVAVAAAAAWNDLWDDDWRQKVSEWDRTSSLNLVIPGTDEFRYITIPVSWGIRPIKRVFEYVSDLTSGEPVSIGDAAAGTLASLIEAYNPVGGTDLASAMTPTVARTPLELTRNVSWSGGKIRPDRDNFAPMSVRYFSDLSRSPTGRAFIEATRAVSEATGGRIEVSPADLQYVLNQMTGGPGTFAGKVTNTVKSIGKGEAPDVRDVPWMSRFVREVPVDRFRQPKAAIDIEKVLTEQSRKRFYEREEAETIYQELVKMPAAQLRATVRELAKTKPELIPRIGQIDKDAAKGLTREDRRIVQLGVENGERAKYLYAVWQGLPKDTRAEWVREGQRKGLISKAVAAQMARLAATVPPAGR